MPIGFRPAVPILLFVAALAAGIAPLRAEAQGTITATGPARRTVEGANDPQRVIPGEGRRLHHTPFQYRDALAAPPAGRAEELIRQGPGTWRAMHAAAPARVALLRLGCAHTSDLGAKREIGPGAHAIILRPSGCCRAPEGGLNGAFDAAGIPVAVMDLREEPLHDTVPGIRLPGRRSREGNAVALRLADFVLAATRRMTLPASGFPGDRRVSGTLADLNPEATPCGDQTEVLAPPRPGPAGPACHEPGGGPCRCTQGGRAAQPSAPPGTARTLLSPDTAAPWRKGAITRAPDARGQHGVDDPAPACACVRRNRGSGAAAPPRVRIPEGADRVPDAALAAPRGPGQAGACGNRSDPRPRPVLTLTALRMGCDRPAGLRVRRVRLRPRTCILGARMAATSVAATGVIRFNGLVGPMPRG